MADNKLSSVVQIDGVNYEVTAKNAENLGGKPADAYQSKLESTGDLQNIKTINGESILGKGNISISGGGGSSDYAEMAEYAVTAGNASTADLALCANTVQVNMEHAAPYAVITVSQNDPVEGNIGDIWFKI